MSVLVHFTGYGTPGSFTGTLTPAENRMKSSFPYPALEAIRKHALAAVTSGNDLSMQVRTVTLLALSTELRGIFDAIFSIPDTELTLRRYNRRKLLDIDSDLVIIRARLLQAYDELRQIGVPEAYLNLLQGRLDSQAYTDRVAAICAIVLLTAILVR